MDKIFKFFAALSRALDETFNGVKPVRTRYRVWPGSDVEFGAYLQSKQAGAAVECDTPGPKVFIYHDAAGMIVGLTVRWPNRNYNYTVLQR